MVYHTLHIEIEVMDSPYEFISYDIILSDNFWGICDPFY